MSSKQITGFRPGSKSWKKFMAKLYGIGASVVIIGALFKIQHWPMAGFFLIVGLGTEAVIFFFSAFEPLHEDLDWTLVYPELAEGLDADEVHEEHEAEAIEDKGSITEQLDNMLEEAKIGPELIASLGSGLQSLSENTSKLSNITDASVATEEFVSNVKGASESTGKLSQSAEMISSSANELAETYNKTAAQVKSQLDISSEDGASYKQQLQSVTSNLQALNSSYQSQLQEANTYAQATNQLNEGVNTLIQNLNDSIEDTRKYKDAMSELASNLGSLNTVYGNMLTAMNFQRQSQPQNGPE